MIDHPKRIKRQLHDLAGTVYEREIGSLLGKLFEDFQQWRAGTITAPELVNRIHRFHNGPSRELYIQCTGNRPDMTVAHALVSGVLKESEVPAEVRQAIANAIAFYQSWDQDLKGRQVLEEE